MMVDKLLSLVVLTDQITDKSLLRLALTNNDLSLFVNDIGFIFLERLKQHEVVRELYTNITAKLERLYYRIWVLRYLGMSRYHNRRLYFLKIDFWRELRNLYNKVSQFEIDGVDNNFIKLFLQRGVL